jgi:hypothetical protein
MAAAYPAYLVATSLRSDNGWSDNKPLAAVVDRWKQFVAGKKEERNEAVIYQAVDDDEHDESSPERLGSNSVAIETIELQRK